MIKAGIIGGAGYTAGELLRILVHHPGVEVTYVHSSSQAGKAVSDLHKDLIGETDLVFAGEVRFETDVLFLCSGHGESKAFLEAHEVPGTVKIIDLSTDYREEDGTHDFVYGLPELQREKIARAGKVANPGCFATCIQLGLLPLAEKGLLKDEVHIHAITGSTGAGVKPTAFTHFSWRDSNISVYKAFNHQHLTEIGQSLRQLQPGFSHPLNFIPVRGDFTRGIFASLYTRFEGSLEEAFEGYESYYRDHPFTHVIRQNPELKQVVNTNKGLVSLEKHGEKLLIISIIDNLLKGASGQAVQNMNLMFGLEETTGLLLKGSAF
ncbi:MAG: N-acetyl-gamma-glutamyl-phosphate reductase [Cyclobacteriaceae bacterium]|nr:N-acetyl-gamma-glutamyl-phosphate reductase [Cyclobacteriaceae bacterium]